MNFSVLSPSASSFHCYGRHDALAGHGAHSLNSILASPCFRGSASADTLTFQGKQLQRVPNLHLDSMTKSPPIVFIAR
jgi:hypothetical protein